MEQPSDPFGSRKQNVDLRIKEFLTPKPDTEQTDGTRLLAKLHKAGVFDQGRERLSTSEDQGKRGKYQFISVLSASLISSSLIALCLTPLDMVLFKQISRTTNLPPKASFLAVWKSIVERPGFGSCMGFAMGSTFVRYFFVLTCLNSYLNFAQQ